MNWVQLIVEVQKTESAALEQLLIESGALAVTYADAGDQPLFEPKPGEIPLWDSVRLIGLFDADSNIEKVIDDARQSYRQEHPGLAFPNHRLEILEDKDWVREWMDQFHPVRFGTRLWVCPSWLKPPEPTAVNVMLDPGLAFGTGTHATTSLCLEWLDSAPLTKKLVIDYGCGSGILGIAALKLGCDKVHAIDIDPQALLATRQNANQNQITEQQLQVCYPNACPAELADILIANILAGPLASLAETLNALIKPGGLLTLSGVLQQQAQAVVDAYSDWFDFAPIREKDGWIMLLARKHL